MGTSTIPVRWRFFSVIFILSFLSYLLRQHFPVAGEFMMKELAISELQMGWVYGAFFWGYLVFQIPGGILGKRFGPRLTLLVAGVIWVLACLLFALLPGSFESSVVGAVGLLIAIRVVMGAAHAPIYPCANAHTYSTVYNKYGINKIFTSTLEINEKCSLKCKKKCLKMKFYLNK